MRQSTDELPALRFSTHGTSGECVAGVGSRSSSGAHLRANVGTCTKTVAGHMGYGFNIEVGNRHGTCANVPYGKRPKSYARTVRFISR